MKHHNKGKHEKFKKKVCHCFLCGKPGYISTQCKYRKKQPVQTTTTNVVTGAKENVAAYATVNMETSRQG